MKSHYQILIVGGGTAGIMTAAMLSKKDPSLDIAILDPAELHYYQPAWTLVGAGTYNYYKTARPMAAVMPDKVKWIQDFATGLRPEANAIDTQNNGALTYDYLVMAPGLVMEPSQIEGLEEALGKGVVCSNYTDPKHTYEVLQNFKGGNALFTQPATPIKCGGAPQKAAYLAADYFKKQGLSNRTNVIFATPGSVIFGVKEIAKTLTRVLNRYQMHFRPFYNPVKIDAENQVATFQWAGQGENQCIVNEGGDLKERLAGEAKIEIPFDMLHLAPPQAAPSFVRESTLANAGGWLDVDIHTLQHNQFKNIFGLGDVAALPTAKTGAAIRKQVPVVVENLMETMKQGKLAGASYNGYSSCPLVTGYGKMVLAEFDYEGNFTPDPKLKQMGVFHSDKEHLRLWWLKKYMLPYLYWNKMLKGSTV
ncbi:MAG: FAD/NAD(P)-binding oxidoreductase [Bacteroidota bacterium]